MEQFNGEDQVSATMDNGEIISAGSECVGESSHDRFGFLTRHGMTELEEGHQAHVMMKKAFLSRMGQLAKHSTILSIHRNTYTSLTGKFRRQTHEILSQAVATRSDGNANESWGWYGASRDDISTIVSHGFCRPDQPVDDRSHGVGIHLTALVHLLDEVVHSVPDGEGIRHILVCRVLMGNKEVISAGSKQFNPSSPEFDSGVDNIIAPRKFILWGAYMNSQINPHIVISFKNPCLKNYSRTQLRALRLTTPATYKGIKFSTLFPILERLLEPSRMELIRKHYDDFQKKKITIMQLSQIVRQIAGDELLTTLAKYNKHN